MASQYHKGEIVAVIGGQYGSEGKGTVVAAIADDFDFHVRVGSHNAGHSFKHEGRVWKMQQIPVGWCNPNALLMLGRGALISPETLTREIEQIAQVDPTIHDRLYIDIKAGILDEHHHNAEGGVHGKIHERIGSTGEGVGAARIDRLRRMPYEDGGGFGSSGFRHFGDLVRDEKWRHLERYAVGNTPHQLNMALNGGARILLEGSQGVHLSVTHGPWPHVTTTDCGAAQLCADVGLPPHWLTDVLLVLRTYPIRVAGNSGPLNYEITWEELSKKLGHSVQERTTVTNKVRRIGVWDEQLVKDAVTLNAPTGLAVNFVDYIDPANEGVSRWENLTETTRDFLTTLERMYKTPVVMIGTGGPDWTIIKRWRQ